MNKKRDCGYWVTRKFTWKVSAAVMFALNLTLQGTALAQNANDRAGDIKLWRDQCNDSDPDLRTAYVEEAIATKGTTIKRICVRLAMESSDDDVRNLGLRAAIAMLKEISFKVEIQPELQQYISDAGDDKKKLEEINNTYNMRMYQIIKNGLTFGITEATVATDRSTWFPYGSLATPSDNYQGPTSIVGDEINWVGNINLDGNYKCRLNATLGNGTQLVGELQCGSYWAFPVSAKLL